jgi:hypothetical protein
MTQAPVGPPPTTEIGHAGSFLPPWNYFGALTGGSDPDEPPELRWPQNLRIYNKMRTDAQVDGLIRSVTVPVRNLRWSIDPNGARDEVVQDIAQQLNLPIRGAEGSDTVKRGRKRFNHDEHLRMALLAPTVFGHMPFEIVGWYPEPPDGENLKWKMRKLAPRMPQSLSKIEIARDGGLVSITQWDSTTATPKPIPVQDLVFYSWEKEGAAWTGRSMLRPLYKHWLLKDRLMRIDTIKNERFGAGIPTGTAPPGGDPADYSKMAQAARASEAGGIGLPNGAGFAINGVSGSLPDTIGSMRYHDEMMAQSFLAMFMKLGQTQTGSRALGETFVDFFVAGLATFANWYAWITNEHVIEDIVDWNWGPDEQAPLLVWDENENEPLGVEELAKLIMSGALVVDMELENWIRAYYGMPAYTGGEPLPTKPANPAQDPGSLADGTPPEPSGTPSAPATAPASGTPAQAASGVVHAHGDHDQSTHGHRHTHGETVPTSPAISSENGTLKTRRARTKFLGKFMGKARYAQVEVEERDGRIVDVVQGSSQTLTKPEVGHREPNEIEASAGTDFKKLQQEWQASTDSLVTAWGPVRKQQIDDLIAQVEAAVEAGKPEDLATIQADVRGADVIMKHMLSTAKSAAEAAVAEAKKQGKTLTVPDDAALTEMLQPRADAMASLLSRGISDSAARQALLRYGVSALTPKDVGAGVRTQLESLSDSYLNDVLGGAMTQAQNGARRDVMSQDEGAQLYASELLDMNTCENCASEDGTEFQSQADADEAYPTGGYVDCLGGPRCRGTLVAIYGEGD